MPRKCACACAFFLCDKKETHDNLWRAVRVNAGVHGHVHARGGGGMDTVSAFGKHSTALHCLDHDQPAEKMPFKKQSV